MQNPSPSPSPATLIGAPSNPTTQTGATTNKAKAPASAPADTSLKRKRGFFQKDLQHLMYGFGDDPNPLPETIALVEDIVVEYITDLVHKAQNVASKRGKLLTEDFLYLIRKDYPKLHRCTELLSMNEELKKARKAFDVSEENLATATD
ncbi:TBP-associated factor 13 [Carex rostrata]